MKFVIIHLQLKNNTEKIINIIWIRIHNDVPDSFFLDLPQYRPKIEHWLSKDRDSLNTLVIFKVKCAFSSVEIALSSRNLRRTFTPYNTTCL